MQVELFSICDAAADYGGRLSVLGTLEGIAAPSTPVIQERCTVAIRMRFNAEENGLHRISLRIIDETEQQIMPDLNAQINVKAPTGRNTSVANLVMNINRLSFPHFGEYFFRMIVDGQARSELPLIVAQAKGKKDVRNPMEN